MSRARLASTSSRAARSASSRSADFVVAIRGGRRGALRIGPRVGGFVGERGVTDAAPIAFQRREGGRRDRDGGIAAKRPPRRSARPPRGTDKACRRVLPAAAASALDRFDEATKRETLARAGRADDSRQERGLRLGATTQSSASGSVASAALRRSARIGGVGIENRIVRGALNDVGGDDRRRGTSAFARRRRLAGNAPRRSSALTSIKRASVRCRRRARRRLASCGRRRAVTIGRA